MKNVLLIAPSWNGLHLDIINGLTAKGYHVEYFPEFSFKDDPLRIKAHSFFPMRKSKAEIKKSIYWENLFSNTATFFDLLIVVDGQGVNRTVFEELRKRNENIYMVNYLYDTTYSMYHFEENFCYFNRVYTFDNKDASNYNIKLLPIYWDKSEMEKSNVPQIAVFGLGAYSANRYRLYHQVKKISDDMGKKSFIKLYAPQQNYSISRKMKNRVKELLGRHDYVPYKIYQSDLFTSQLIPTDEFRRYVHMADVILDTNVLNQDGLTARFMWALGAGKKIITTNSSVYNYVFYNPEQILVLKDTLFTESEKDVIKNFINAQISLSKEHTLIVEKFRLDNWLETLLTS
jgi:hypothetical protein